MRDLAAAEEREQALGELEALLFAATRALRVAEIARRLGVSEEAAQALLAEYAGRLEAPGRGLRLQQAGVRYRLHTKPEHNDVLTPEARRERPLTTQALEVLAVIALAQPVTALEVSRTRGAESYAAIETLRRHGLVAAATVPGHTGRAVHWRTTQQLLDRLGLRSVAELAQAGGALLNDRTAARRLAGTEVSLKRLQ